MMPRPETHRVAVIRGATAYPPAPPFDPPNDVYAAVEQVLAGIGLDAGRAGTPDWNPLGDLVAPGQHVVIKPNFVSARNFHQRYDRDDFLCCCTHPSVLRPLLDLAWRAVAPTGSVTIAEAPLEGGDLPTTLAALGVTAMLDTLRRTGINVELIDLRDFQIVPRMAIDDWRVLGRSLNVGVLRRFALPGDPRGYATVDLAAGSAFAAFDGRCERFRFHHSNPGWPPEHHRDGRHEYTMAKTMLAADLIVSVPKMKTHKKTGVTLSLKNMIGTTNQKYWLPHFAAGAPPDGDEYPVRPPLGARWAIFWSRVTLPNGDAAVVRFPPADRREEPYIYDGNWSGNDTVWRTTLDLNRILRYADREGRLHATPQRRVLSLIDGIVAGQGNGPLAPSPKACGVLIGGLDAWACDLVATRMMGIDPTRIGFLSDAARARPHPVTDLTPGQIEVVPAAMAAARCDFELPRGWRDVRAAGETAPT
jgi:uncharacterized protein (DUF362 family)